MPRIDPAAARQFAADVVRRLRDAGHEAVWAGGCVRDQLLGKHPKDYDVATSARPREVRDLFGHRRTLAIGAAFGVVAVRGPRHAGAVEVATFRSDGGYSDGRHPDSVTFSTAELDAQRRDFTINGLFYDPLAEKTIDYVGGVADLENRLVRAIGDPRARIAEDKLRMLRAVRFAATFDFALDPPTLAAVQQQAHELVIVSAERIAAELRRMLVNRHRVRAVELLRESGLLDVVLPEASSLYEFTEAGEGDLPWRRTLTLLGQLNKPTFVVALSALLLGICRSTAFDDAESSAVVIRRCVEAVSQRWRLSNDEREGAVWLLTHESTIRRATSEPWPRVQRLLIAPRAAELVGFAEAVGRTVDDDSDGVAVCRRKLDLAPEELNPPALIDGEDLKRLGIAPGPAYRWLLEAVRDAQLEGRIGTREEALRLAEELHRSRS